MSNDERISHTSVEEASRRNAETAEESKPISTAAMYYLGLRPGSVRVGELQIALLGGCGGGALAKKKWDFLSMYRRFFVQIGRSTHRWLRLNQTKQNQHNSQVTYVTGYRS